MYLPLATEGFALITLEISVVALSDQLVGRERKSFPPEHAPAPSLSVRNSTCPPSLPAPPSRRPMVTVPVFGFGISPFGPSTLPNRPTDFIMSGVATQRVKVGSSSLFVIFSTMSSPPTKSAPAALGLTNLFAARDH